MFTVCLTACTNTVLKSTKRVRYIQCTKTSVSLSLSQTHRYANSVACLSIKKWNDMLSSIFTTFVVLRSFRRLVCVLQCSFSPYVMGFFEKTIHEEYISIESTNSMSCTRNPSTKSYFLTHRSAWTVLYMNTSFLSVNRYIGVYIKTKTW